MEKTDKTIKTTDKKLTKIWALKKSVSRFKISNFGNDLISLVKKIIDNFKLTNYQFFLFSLERERNNNCFFLLFINKT